MSIVFTIVFACLTVWAYAASWSTWTVIVLGLAAAICLVFALARYGAFGSFIADVLDELVPSDYAGFDDPSDSDFDIYDFD